MRAEIKLETEQLVDQIVKGVLNVLEPLLSREPNDTLLTVETLAEYLHVSKQWIYERIQLKEIPYFKIGKFPRFKKSEIDKWLCEFKVPVTKIPSKMPRVRVNH